MSITFQGYMRPDGRAGSRNYVAVIPSVICATDVAQAICRQVAGTIGFFHHQGCCQLPIDLKRVTDTLTSLALSPNVGAVLLVSLGRYRHTEDHGRSRKKRQAIRSNPHSGTGRNESCNSAGY